MGRPMTVTNAWRSTIASLGAAHCLSAIAHRSRRDVGATAQDKGTLNPKPLPPLANPDDPKTPAKELFGRKRQRRRRCRRAPSASTPRAVSPAPWRCRSTARPGR